jgi:hypothetical protein
MKRWSKLQKEVYDLIDPKIGFQLHCRLYRMNSQYGSTDLPRYWISIGKEIIWDYPKDFINKPHPERTPPKFYPYGTDVPDISNLIREYIDTPKNELIDKKFENDHWGLINILRAADRRIGKRQFEKLNIKIKNKAALIVLQKRMDLS